MKNIKDTAYLVYSFKTKQWEVFDFVTGKSYKFVNWPKIYKNGGFNYDIQEI